MNLLYTLSFGYIFTIVSFVLVVINLSLTIWLIVRLKRLVKGGDGKSIESALQAERKIVEDLVKYKEESSKYLFHLDERVKEKVGSIEAIRFNPFQGAGLGGNNSFSMTLVDEKGKGVVLSGLHTRERMNVFVKPVENWKGELELSEEEENVLNNAKTKSKVSK